MNEPKYTPVHTPEPWALRNSVCGHNFIDMFSIKTEEIILIQNNERIKDWPRIVSCVNAMAGIEDPQKLRDAWEVAKDLELDAYYKLKENYYKLFVITEKLLSRLEYVNEFTASPSASIKTEELIVKTRESIKSLPGKKEAVTK